MAFALIIPIIKAQCLVNQYLDSTDDVNKSKINISSYKLLKLAPVIVLIHSAAWVQVPTIASIAHLIIKYRLLMDAPSQKIARL